jgi:hypothetical protein
MRVRVERERVPVVLGNRDPLVADDVIFVDDTPIPMNVLVSVLIPMDDSVYPPSFTLISVLLSDPALVIP